MKIYTTYFSNVKKLPPHIIPISIAAKNPSSWHGLTFKKLAPPWYLVKDYKVNGDKQSYTSEYQRIVLQNLKQDSIVMQLASIACIDEFIVKRNDGCEIAAIKTDRDIALICYENPEDFCHRHLVAEWLNQSGYNVTEWHAL